MKTSSWSLWRQLCNRLWPHPHGSFSPYRYSLARSITMKIIFLLLILHIPCWIMLQQKSLDTEKEHAMIVYKHTSYCWLVWAYREYDLRNINANLQTGVFFDAGIMQGQNGATAVDYPESWQKLLTTAKADIASGAAPGFMLSYVQTGISFNFNKICGCLLLVRPWNGTYPIQPHFRLSSDVTKIFHSISKIACWSPHSGMRPGKLISLRDTLHFVSEILNGGRVYKGLRATSWPFELCWSKLQTPLCCPFV